MASRNDLNHGLSAQVCSTQEAAAAARDTVCPLEEGRQLGGSGPMLSAPGNGGVETWELGIYTKDMGNWSLNYIGFLNHWRDRIW